MPRNLNLSFDRVKSLSSLDDPPIPQTNPHRPFSSLYDSDVADFATAFASQRFFFSSPGRSNSIVDSSSSSIASTSFSFSAADNAAVFRGSVAVPTFSPDPFADFRRSMQEMVEARELHDVAENWEYLHELLMCYLSLNPKTTHKFIVGAFADLLVTLLKAAPEKTRRRKTLSDDKCKI